ncbi:uncharacterized protein K489DRAFT_349523 [Dissoconium aciculare CBS 342.82]|uniref:Transcription factor SipA3 n=1 Tax=Dissoconium aciculare CBS 342.82 TaxID=1314786 RepID=A0A6J3MIU3_9PEZI|nr:uncharacterized protein K489DRAFT_349523 [Dissoconium aciculare CBS 342.82]KAF1827825.1 hypothetical protein K489DRAFT_349523 [Dissoconium aciculare CBS 342.82]
MTEEQGNPVLVRRLNLIPVGLKEAALDSPTFRATATHFGDQIDTVERWLDGYVKSVSKMVAEMSTLEPLVNTFLSHATPPHQITEAILDHDYTLLAMQRYAEGAKEFWHHTLRVAKRYDATILEPIRSFMNSDLKSFKDARRAMDNAQRTFDNVISRYLGQNKTKEASSLREDAFQLHEARKAYLKASMDFCVLAPQLRNAVDKLIVRVFCDQWKELRNSKEAHAGSFTKFSHEMDRIRGWSREMENSERAFKRELATARKQLEDNAEQASRPSRELEDYAASTVPYLGTGASAAATSKGKTQDKAEKQGWLYLRSVTGRPPRTVWSRRWFFVKNGIFGWLMQGTRSGGVEESEKIGVLLCSVRPAFQEERRFCFEVKTSDASIILQAETQSELTEWITAFEAAKRKALEDPTSTHGSSHISGVDAAFAISPPIAPEFAAKSGDGHAVQNSDDFSANASMPDRENAHHQRATSDAVLSRRVASPDRDGEGAREHASRIKQKLDLTKRGAAANQPGSGAGGIASLISASHNVLPLGPGAPLAASEGVKRSMTMPMSSLAPSTLANPPAPTNLSHTAIVVGGERGYGLGRADGSSIPSGLLANLWGSSNWAYINRLDDDLSPDTPTESVSGGIRGSSPSHRKTVSVGNDIAMEAQKLAQDDAANEYPNYYPVSLKAQNSQFRMLFPQVSRKEKVVLVFRATWNPNEQQEFPGRVYVTPRQIYFFSNHLGLVLITSVRLNTITEVTAAPGRDCDFLYLLLKENSSQDDARRITVKVFLEPLKLLQRRLNFLVENAQESEPANLETILKRLIKLEVEVPQRSSSVESWEDITYAADEAADGATIPARQKGRNIKTSLRIDDNLYGDPVKTGREIQKFKLPAQPVNYAPRDMQASMSKDFTISAKALFHVIFGDKSAVFQVHYWNTWGEKVAQSPWSKIENGPWTRTFSSQDNADVLADTQSIDIYNDHLCYVVTNTKYPRRLPYADRFILTTKYVITHSAKSRCKLAIFQSVRWHKSPILSYVKYLVEREAYNVLRADASDLAAISTDQVSKLGTQSKTNKSIDVFGSIGVNKQAAQIDFSQAPSVSKLQNKLTTTKARLSPSIHRLVLHDVLSKLLQGVSFIVDIIVAISNSVVSVCTAHTFLVGLLLISALYNSWHGYRDGLVWYQERRATKFMGRIGVTPTVYLSKAIYLQDIYELISPTLENDTTAALSSTPSGIGRNSSKTCRTTFSEKLALSTAIAPSTSGIAARVVRTRNSLARYRHDLLVALRVVNRVERDVVLAEWEDWVRSEEDNCARIEGLLRQGEQGVGHGNQDAHIVAELGEEFLEYCDSCRSESRGLSDGMELI